MSNADQEMRARWGQGDFSGENLDATHTNKLKEIIDKIGWPTITQVGKNGSEQAWLLAQHADHDPDFQAFCLDLMKELPLGEVNPSHIAYLEDRVRVNRGEPQLYGTQFDQIGGKHVLFPIEDENEVNSRRNEVGLGPLSEQIALMEEQYPLD
jgi:hypothetical protein